MGGSKLPPIFGSRSVLRVLFQLHRQHIARCAVQDVIGGGAQQQGQAVTAMAADHDQVAALFLGQVMDFLAWLTLGQVALTFFQVRVLGDQALKAFLGLIELLLLQL